MRFNWNWLFLLIAESEIDDRGMARCLGGVVIAQQMQEEMHFMYAAGLSAYIHISMSSAR